MAFHTSGLAIRQADRGPGPNLEHTKLPTLSQSFMSGNSLGIYTADQRLPPISVLLGEIPRPPVQAQFHPSFPPSPLPSPIGASPSLFSAPYPTWPALPPRPRSVAGHHPGFFPHHETLVPRRASTDCISAHAAPSSYYVPERTLNYYQRACQDREYNRQRRTTKQATRRQRQSRSPDSSSSDADHPTGPARTTTGRNLSPKRPAAARKNRSNNTNISKNGTKEKRNNQPYTFEQESFMIYHRVDLKMDWDEVRTAYMARWPGLNRSVSGLECAYYRLNSAIPAITPDGLLLLVDPEVGDVDHHPSHQDDDEQERAGWAAVGSGRGGELTPPGTPETEKGCGGGGGEEGEDDEGRKGGVGYKYYRGVAYRTRQIKCRKAEVSLMERFPEELVDERNDWVREEHRVSARGIAERRCQQREEWLAAKVRQQHQRMMHL